MNVPMPAASDPLADVPVNYVLDILGNVLFLQALRGVVAGVPVWVANAPDVNVDRISAFFQQVVPDLSPQIYCEKNLSRGKRDFWEIDLDYKAKSIIATAFPEEFCQEEQILIQRFRENTTQDAVILQLKNFLAKIGRIREIYAMSTSDVRQDPKRFFAAVQKEFRKAPVSHEFVQFVVDRRSVGQARSR
jgi:hypothetical protein